MVGYPPDRENDVLQKLAVDKQHSFACLITFIVTF